MNPDIYWSHACINALKYNDLRVFHYSIQFIIDIVRKEKLNQIYEKVIYKDFPTISTLEKYSCPFLIHIV